MTTLARLGQVSFSQQFTAVPSPKRPFVMRGRHRAVQSAVKALSSGRIELNRSANALKLRDLFPALDWPCLSKIHSDIASFDGAILASTEVYFPADLHKQHFPPTDENRKLLRSVRKVVLTRAAEDSIASYGRLPNPPDFFRQAQQSPQLMERLLNELRMWSQGWEDEAKESGSTVIDFSQLMRDQDGAVRRAAAALGIEISEDTVIALDRKRHYR